VPTLKGTEKHKIPKGTQNATLFPPERKEFPISEASEAEPNHRNVNCCSDQLTMKQVELLVEFSRLESK
jgi:hypothetical protein